ncbi:hypothetical protein SAMN05428978_101613 [Nitrosomonas sp. Nm34]|nr:hypothetical protein SAMN05428978_101613 [Nitrosomonas sp. Nm34]
MAYAQLTLAERNYIEMRLKHGDSQLPPYAGEQEGQTTPCRQTQSH